MQAGFLDRLDEALAQDCEFIAAIKCLPGAAGTVRWPAAEQVARAASSAALRRALWSGACPRTISLGAAFGLVAALGAALAR
jgi:hypothetical protein